MIAGRFNYTTQSIVHQKHELKERKQMFIHVIVINSA